MKKINIRKHKIRTRIMLLYLILSAALLAILIPVVYFGVKFSTEEGLETNMEKAVDDIKESLYYDAGELCVNKDIYSKDFSEGGVYVRVCDENGRVIFHTFSAEMMLEWLLEEQPVGLVPIDTQNLKINPVTLGTVNFSIDENGASVMVFDENYLYEALAKGKAGWKVVREEYEVDGHKAGIVVVGNIYLNRFLDNIFKLVYVIVPLYLLLAAFGARIFAKRALKPVADITNTARVIKSGELDKRIDVDKFSPKDEVGELAETFNEMLDELEVSFKREKRFTSDASHELRTPVSVISACVDEAMNTKDESIVRENLEMIRNENSKMTKIISQLLTLSRGYEGKYSFEPEEITLFDMVDSVAEVNGFEAEKRNITIENKVSEDIVIHADQSLYTQVLMNIVTNAIKYGKDNGHITIESDEDEEYVWTIVSDDGIGMTEEDLKHIFERFYRADAARDRNGSGLGLSIVKWIMDLHKGLILVESEPQKGTVFKLGLPKTNKQYA